MRKIINVNEGWNFYKNTADVAVKENGEIVNLPHTWNATDGQDGGNDYFRGSCVYAKTFDKKDLPQGELVYLEIRGANSSADVYLNGEKLAHHDGGYSTWRVNLTDGIKDQNEIAIVVDNAANDFVYPQVADFTFYGGLYRSVNLIGVDKTHFDLDYYGAPGIMITPKVDGTKADVEIKTFITGEYDQVVYSIFDADSKEIASATEKDVATLEIADVVLWNGRKNPYLYKVFRFSCFTTNRSN